MDAKKTKELAEWVKLIANMRLWSEIEDCTDYDQHSWILDSDKELERIILEARDLIKE